MRTNRVLEVSMRQWRNAGLVVVALFGLSMFALAQDYRDYRDYQWGYQGYGNNNVANQNAYNYGYAQGQQDRASGRRFDAKNGSYRIDKNYRNVYAQGYQAGYYGQQAGVWGRDRDRDRDRDHDRDDWRWRRDHGNGQYGYGNGPYNGTYGAYPNGNYGYGYGANNPAYQYGYKDGFDLGANDARSNHQYNDHGSGAYKHADNGFPGGNKEAYQQAYRQAYQQGYRAGWDQARGGYGYRR
jgi:hypothetical protein